jgi:hypothetical protein
VLDAGLITDMVTAITILVKGIVPEEINNSPKEYIDKNYEIYGGAEYDSGFNSCRTEILKRVEGK